MEIVLPEICLPGLGQLTKLNYTITFSMVVKNGRYEEMTNFQQVLWSNSHKDMLYSLTQHKDFKKTALSGNYNVYPANNYKNTFTSQSVF